jgi:hypothetical protein
MGYGNVDFGPLGCAIASYLLIFALGFLLGAVLF